MQLKRAAFGASKQAPRSALPRVQNNVIRTIASAAAPRHSELEAAANSHHFEESTSPANDASQADQRSTGVAANPEDDALLRARQAKRQRRVREQAIYQGSAIAATLLFGGMATFATFYRFFYHNSLSGSFPWFEFCSTLAMIGGGVVCHPHLLSKGARAALLLRPNKLPTRQVAMEMYARWAHRVLWHDFQPGWAIHKSHHEPRIGPFEKNDIFAVMNAVPAIALTAYGFFTPNEIGGLCFGFGMGITTFGILYMFVHDGLVHKRFPVGPIAELPQLKRIAVAHRLHHSEKYGGVPFGMFLGPQELEAVGAGTELDRLVEEMKLTQMKLTQMKQ